MGLEPWRELLLSVPFGKPLSDGHYKFAGRSSHAGATWHYEHAVWDDWNTGAETTRTALYVRYNDAAGYAVPVGTNRVAGFAALAVLLVASGNMCLTGDMDSMRPESPMVHGESPGRLTLPGRMLNLGQQVCTPLLHHPNRILASPRLCILLTPDSTISVSTGHGSSTTRRQARTQSVHQARVARQSHGVGPH